MTLLGLDFLYLPVISATLSRQGNSQTSLKMDSPLDCTRGSSEVVKNMKAGIRLFESLLCDLLVGGP